MSKKIIAVAAFLCTAVISAALFIPSAQAFGFFSKYQEVRAEKGIVSIPLAEVSDGAAHFYEFAASGRSVRFFVLKSSDGVIRSAFDACDVCFEARKGYQQDGDFMVCQNCGQRFHSAQINEVRGGCNPAPLDRVADNNSVRFNVADIAAGVSYF